MLAHNPCSSVELPRKTANEMQSLTPKEAARFVEEAASDRWSALFVLALATGLRPSEYLGLKWADIDLEQGVINVQRSLHWISYKSGDWYFGEPKTPRSKLEQMLFAKTGIQKWATRIMGRRNYLILFGWEAGTRTPIARSRVWSPTIGRPPSTKGLEFKSEPRFCQLCPHGPPAAHIICLN